MKTDLVPSPPLVPQVRSCFSQYPVSIPVPCGYQQHWNCTYPNGTQPTASAARPSFPLLHESTISKRAPQYDYGQLDKTSEQILYHHLLLPAQNVPESPATSTQLPELFIDTELPLQLVTQYHPSRHASQSDSNLEEAVVSPPQSH